jgi:hypothetical protein
MFFIRNYVDVRSINDVTQQSDFLSKQPTFFTIKFQTCLTEVLYNGNMI